MLIDRLFPTLFFAPADGNGTGDDDTGGSELEQDLGDLAGDEGDGDDDDPSGDDEGGSGDADPDGEEGDEEGGDEEEEDGEEADDDEEEEEGDEEDDDDKEKDKGKKKKEPEVDELGRPSIKAIKTMKDGKYADLFKDIPSLKAAFFELPKFKEVFPDVESAQEAATKSTEYDRLEASLVHSADPTFLIKTLAENAPKQLTKLMGKFADVLKTEHEESYRAMATPILEELLYHASQHGGKVGGQQGKNLQLAARHIANFLWANGGDIPDISKREKAPEQSEAEKELERERSTYKRERFTAALETVQEECADSLKVVLANKLDKLTPFERKMVIKEAKAELDTALNKDKALSATLNSLWKKAAEDNYSPASKARIKNAWLARAKVVAPAIRNRLKEEAIKARTSGDGDSTDRGGKKRSFPERGGQQRGGSSKVVDPSKIDWRKTSDADILSDDTNRVTRKK